MKAVLPLSLLTLCFLILNSSELRAHETTPSYSIQLSHLDPALQEARDQAAIPWSTPKESGKFWKELSPTHIPILNEQNEEGKGRDLYIPNPGTAYWVLGGLTKERFFKVHQEKLKIKDALISATVSKQKGGSKIYWALWAPANKAHLIYAEMEKFGIQPAQAKPTLLYSVTSWIDRHQTFRLFFMCIFLALNLFVLLYVTRKNQKESSV